MAEIEHELRILEEIERNPNVTQSGLAVQLGVAVGSINWYMKRLIGKGYLKVTHLQRRKLHYFLTPSGLGRKFELTRSYMDVSLRVYRELRQAALAALAEVRQRGCDVVYVDDEGEAADILRLTCLEQGILLSKGALSVPILRSDGLHFDVAWPEAGS